MELNLNKLKGLHGKYATWAIWEAPKNLSKKTIADFIEDNKNQLHNNYVLIGLNASAPRYNDWGSFRDGKHDRKLMYAFSDSKIIKGCYITDLYRIIESKSLSLKKELKNKSEKEMRDYALRFKNEMADIGINNHTTETKFLIFGRMAFDYYEKYFKNYFPHIKVIRCRHYSARGTDKEWVEGVWRLHGINDNFDPVINKKTAKHF